MKIHEYQARQIFEDYGIPVPEVRLCFTVDEVKQAALDLNRAVVIKAQVLVGGRGKAGGVKLAKTVDDAVEAGSKILGMDIKGNKVEKVMVVGAVDIQKEYYVGLTIDRNTKSVLFMASAEGGVEIEEVAKTNPEAIHKIPIDPDLGMTDFMARKIAFKLFNDINQVKQAASIFKKMYQIFMDTDASIVEINPLVTNKDGNILAIDGKMNFDDNALYRQPNIAAMNEPDEDEKKELKAKESGLSYIRLDGNIGCMVNGAGLAMATMDVVKHFGGSPANFLDIGGSSSPQKVVDAMNLLLSDKNVKVIMINIFGGITRCDDVAKGLVIALEQLKTNIPIVIRLSGTNAEEGLRIIADQKLPIVASLSEAAKEAIRLVNNMAS
jgi:succinyl-CoA synthetase beta subunit